MEKRGVQDDVSPNKCVDCGHDIMVYHHPMSSGLLIFHDNNGVFSGTCTCGCKNPKKRDNGK